METLSSLKDLILDMAHFHTFYIIFSLRVLIQERLFSTEKLDGKIFYLQRYHSLFAYNQVKGETIWLFQKGR